MSYLEYSRMVMGWPLPPGEPGESLRTPEMIEEINAIIAARVDSIAIAFSPRGNSAGRCAVMELAVRNVVAVMAWQPDLGPTPSDLMSMRGDLMRVVVQWATRVQKKRGRS